MTDAEFKSVLSEYSLDVSLKRSFTIPQPEKMGQQWVRSLISLNFSNFFQ